MLEFSGGIIGRPRLRWGDGRIRVAILLMSMLFTRFRWLVWGVLLGGTLAAQEPAPASDSAKEPETPAVANTPAPRVARDDAEVARVMVIPVRAGIDKPILYVIRRGLKQAIDQDFAMVVLDMETPGGRLDVTFDIMEALEKFDGVTATFINDEAISAGAFISAMTDEIYFSPRGVIGAAAPVSGTGAEIDESMKMKIVSYLKARIRSISEGHVYRGQVISAMIDADYELKIGEEVLKPKGELLSLTATEASKVYGEGDDAAPLLAAGIVDDVDALLTERFGAGNYAVTELEVTWSEELAEFLNGIAPILLGLGLLGLFIEFKTPGFGVFGIGGGVLLGIVFLSNYVAGFSGHEPVLVFALGAVLVIVELIFIPGIVVLALSGIVMMLGSLLWAMADFWPNQPMELGGDVLIAPLVNMGLGLVVAVVGAVVLLRFLPRGWFWDRMILAKAVGDGGPVVVGAAPQSPLVGRRGVAATDLFPSGQIEIEGRRYEARVALGFVEAGTAIEVVRAGEFGLVVEAREAEGDA